MRTLIASIGLIWVLGLSGPEPIEAAEDSLHLTARSVYSVPGMRDVWGYESGGKEYALVCLGDRLEIIDCTNPDSISLVRSVPSTSGDLKDVKIYQNYAYAINQFGPMQIINLSNPAAAFTQAHFSTPAIPSGHNLYIDGSQGFGYVSLNGSGARDMRIIDLSFPTAPAEVGHFTHPSQGNLFADAHDAYARNDSAWVSYLDGGFAILDVSNKAAPGLLALVTYPATTNHNVWTADNGDYVYTTDERSGGHVRVWDARDLKDIREVAAYDANPSGSVHNVHIDGDFCFVSYYVMGVRILDIEDPGDPIEVAYYDTYPGAAGLYNGCWGVYPFATSGTIYASDRTEGLFVLHWDSTKAGRIEGGVTLGHDGSAGTGVQVSKLSLGRAHATDAAGLYSWRIGGDIDTLVFERAGFHPDTVAVSGELGVTQQVDLTLQPLPTARIVGTVQTESGAPLPGARVGVMGEDFFDVVTDEAGGFELDFVLADSDQVIIAGLWGYGSDTVRVNLFEDEVDTLAFALTRGYRDHFELDLGWTVGTAGDNATSGIWERVNPVGTKNFAAYQTQPEDDYDLGPAAKCYVTGQATPGIQVTVTDVDGGYTSLVSPYINLTGIVDPVLNLRYWYVNNAGANPNRDTLWFELSVDSGQTWFDIGSTRFPLNNWWPFAKSLVAYQGLPQPVRFRVRAGDSGDESVVEVGIDAFEITGDYPLPQAGDMDQNGSVAASDVIYLVNYIFKDGPAPITPESGDVNASCSVTAGDVVYLVNFVFKGGPVPLPPCAP